MVDGRVPMLGSNAKLARPTIQQALADPPGVALALTLGEADRNTPLRKKLTIALENPAKSVVGRSLVVGIATVEDRVTTRVESGENANKTLLNRYAVRSLEHRPAKLTRGGKAKLEVPIELDADWNAANASVTVFVQDEQNGRVYQAGSVRWRIEAKVDADAAANSGKTPAR